MMILSEIHLLRRRSGRKPEIQRRRKILKCDFHLLTNSLYNGKLHTGTIPVVNRRSAKYRKGGRMPLTPVHIFPEPGEKYQLSSRYWQGCPTILRTPGGKLFAGWYSGGTKEPSPENYNLLISSSDNGWTWSKPLLVVPSEAENNFISIDIQLWLDPNGRMWMFITQRYLNVPDTELEHLALWAFICDDPDAEELQWSEPRYIAPGFLRTQPTVLSNGDWVLCSYNWATENYCYSRSKDQGKTWFICQAGKKLAPDFDETMILERRDGTLLMLARDLKPLLVKTVSSDLEGSSWTPGTYTRTINATSRIYLRRLRSGRVLLIHNDSTNYRTDLVAKLSEDDGETWKYSLQLDKAENHINGISYPDAVQADDGTIYIVYDHGRMSCKEIVMAQITEEDIIQGSITNNNSYLHRIISKAPVPEDMERYEAAKAADAQWIRDVFDPLLIKIKSIREKNR